MTLKDQPSSGAPFSSFPIEPRRVDEELVALFGAQRYDRINHVVNDRVCETYRHELYGTCKSLLENEKIIGRFIEVAPKEKVIEDEEDQNWERDPNTMSNAELFRARAAMRERIEQQKLKNQKLLANVQILELAEKAIDLEAGCAALALQLEESKIVD
jgi:hypothetical protein